MTIVGLRLQLLVFRVIRHWPRESSSGNLWFMGTLRAIFSVTEIVVFIVILVTYANIITYVIAFYLPQKLLWIELSETFGNRRSRPDEENKSI